MLQRILIVGHSDNTLPLPVGYEFVQRSHPTILNARSQYAFRNPSLIWSEYSAWFENYHLLEDAKVSGLEHYRCALNLTPLKIKSLPMIFRFYFLALQSRMLRGKTNFIITGTPFQTPEGMWQQFAHWHPESIDALVLAANAYDRILGFSTESTKNRLITTRAFITRNIFITDTDFSKAWIAIALEIAMDLDSNFQPELIDRWGGFILERLFSFYIEDFCRLNNVNLTYADHIYFVNAIAWFKTFVIKRLVKPLLKIIHLR